MGPGLGKQKKEIMDQVTEAKVIRLLTNGPIVTSGGNI